MWLANLSLTQIYVPLTLTAGLTQMWSLSVEVSFYLALPILALLARRIPVRLRVPVIAAVALAIGHGLDPVRGDARLNPLNWPPAFCSWFAAGMLLAEWLHSHSACRTGCAPAGADGCGGAFGVSGGASPLPGRWADAKHRRPIRGQDGDGRGAGLRVGGAVGAGSADTPHRFLASEGMVTLGRWSYGIFVWHLAALAMVFPVIGEFAFSGSMPVVLVLTLVFAIAIAAVSYALVESPCREALRRWNIAALNRPRPSRRAGLEPVSSVAAPATV
ncbi:putative acyltransferase [Mycobacterium xenopi 3993]|nr:putative acyltransferase [Mycobacterium xenopi 3993]